jgi:outer membrane protein assembly factor BamE (lipoprotein component of BamABCDE complex)
MFNQVGNYYFYISHKLLIKDIKLKSVDVKILEIKFNKNFIENFLNVLKLNKKDFFLNKTIHKNKSKKKTFLVFIGFFFYLKNLFHL